MTADSATKSVIVGIDGSPAALAAAQWGADEALGRGAVLQLLHVVDANRGLVPGVVKAQYSLARAVLQEARAAVEATHQAIQIQTEIIDGDPGTTLSEASWSAAVLCVGAPKAAPHGPHDSLAANMATSAHSSVAIVPAEHYSAHPHTGCVAVLLHASSDEYDVLQQAMEEAYLRKIPLHAIMQHRSGSADVKEGAVEAAATHPDTAIEERLVNWACCYPGIDTQIVHAGQLNEYVAEHQRSIRSVVLGGEHRCEIGQLVELTRSAALRDTNFVVYVVRVRHL